MNKRWNTVLATVAVAGLVLLAPSAASGQKGKPAPEKKPCDCVILDDFDIRIPDVNVHIPDFTLPALDFPGITLPDMDFLEAQLTETLAGLEDQLAWAQDEKHMEELRAHLEAQKAEIERHAREAAEHARALAQDWNGYAQGAGTAIFLEDGESGWLGISISEVTAEKAKELKLPAERGVLVGEVESESAAAKAGIKEGDVITEFNGQKVEGTVQFRRMVRETPAGRSVALTLWRDGRAQALNVELGSRQAQWRDRDLRRRIEIDPQIRVMPRIEVFASRTPTLGISGEDVDGQLGAYFGAPDGEGVLIKEVHEGTPAEKGGLKAGDVITRIDGDRIKTVSELRAKLREKRESKSVKVEVVRKGSAMSLDVEIEQPKPPARRAISRRISA
jgi:serine protease Do